MARHGGDPARPRLGGPLAACPGCGLVLPARDGPAHPYIGASPACWALFGELLAREYADPRYRRVHRTTVDAYATQHPGVPERRSVQSVALHLAGLLLVFEEGMPSEHVTARLRAVSGGFREPRWLEPPRSLGEPTVRDVLGASSAAEHEREVLRWAGAVWAAWEPHHATVRSSLSL